MPYIDSNILNNIFYSAFVCEILRRARSSLHFSVLKVCESVSRLLGQGVKVQNCYSSLKKNIDKYPEDCSKFDNDTNYLIR